MRAVPLFIALAISSCSTSIPLPLALGEAAHVKILGSAGGECVVEPSDRRHQELQRWLDEHQKGWSQIYHTPPSGGIMLTTPRVHLQLVGGTAYATVPAGILTRKVSGYAFLDCRSGA